MSLKQNDIWYENLLELEQQKPMKIKIYHLTGQPLLDYNAVSKTMGRLLATRRIL